MHCERCGGRTTARSMSKFNVDFICPDCETRERAHPLFPEADRRESAEVARGNYNFEGIGLPDDLRPATRKKERE